MHISKLTLTLAISALALGCVVNDDDATGSGTETNGTGDGSGSMTTPTATMTMTASNTNGQTGDTTEGPSTDTDPGTDSGTTAVDPGPFVADDPDPSLYTRVDRLGMPAVNTALIPCADPMAGDCAKDDYNNSDRSDDLANAFIAEISASVGFLLGGLTAELTNDPMDMTEPGLGLTSCGTINACVNQAGPLVIPDTLKIDLTAGAGFPNGRTLPDPVIDVTLAVLLLDLGTHPATLFADVPVNPPENDLPFGKEFPFLADPH